MMPSMSRAELLALVRDRLTIELEIARRPWGLGRTKTYQLAAAGELPFPVNHLGNTYVVPVEPFLRSLGIVLVDDELLARWETAEPGFPGGQVAVHPPADG